MADGQHLTELAPGLHISPVLIGLWQVADLERDGRLLDPDREALSLKLYRDAGLTTFDMADHYGSAEDIAGVFKSKYGQGAVQLFTKWVPPPGAVSTQQVRAAVQKSLTRLQSEQIDLLQFHAWNYADPSWLEALYFLQQLKDEGLIAHLGLTNFDAAHLNLVANSGIHIATNQVCFSLLDRRASGAMTQTCLQHGIKLLAFGTVAGGFLSEKWLDQPEPSLDSTLTWSQMKYKRFIDTAGGWQKFQDLLHVLHKLSGDTGASIANLASRYILDQPAVGGVIIGARLGKSQHIDENLKLRTLRLDASAYARLTPVLEALTPIPGDCGDEYRKPPYLTASGDLSHHLETLPPPYPVQHAANGRMLALSGTPWETMAGFSRAARQGNRILVSGTTATLGNRVMGGADPAAQAHFVIDKIEGAIRSLGGTLADVVRTRIYIKRMSDWEAIARVHGVRFGAIQPANTLIKAELIGEGYLLEMEAEAIVS